MSHDSLHTDHHFVNDIIDDYISTLDEEEKVNNVDLIIYIQQIIGQMYDLTTSIAIKKLSYGYLNQLICYYLIDKNVAEKGIYFEVYGNYNVGKDIPNFLLTPIMNKNQTLGFNNGKLY